MGRFPPPLFRQSVKTKSVSWAARIVSLCFFLLPWAALHFTYIIPKLRQHLHNPLYLCSGGR